MYREVMIFFFIGFIYWVSLGLINLLNMIFFVEFFQDIDVYVMVVGVSKVKMDDILVIQCLVGILKKEVNFDYFCIVLNKVCFDGFFNIKLEFFIFSCK